MSSPLANDLLAYALISPRPLSKAALRRRSHEFFRSESSPCITATARNPGFTATVIITLALSIGANTAIFSMVNALMLKSLPYPQPDRMGTLFQREQGAEASDEMRWIDGTQWEHLRDNVPSLISAVSCFAGRRSESGSRPPVEYVHDGRVSAHYFDVLGIRPALGRSFNDEEDRPSGPKAAILSYNLWRTTFGADPDLIGQTIHLKGEPYTVIGILPQGQITPLNADLYTALQPSPHRRRAGHQLRSHLPSERRRDLAAGRCGNESRLGLSAYRRSKAKIPAPKSLYYTVPLQRGMTAELRPRAIALMLSAGFILLIACANLAGLTLVRMSRRLPEIATRMALGASHWQIQKQLWIENLLLACLGGAAGIGVGFAALRGLLSLLPEGFLPVASVPLDGRVLAFTMAVSLLTSVLFGMLPALVTSRVDLRSSMTSRGASAGQSVRLRQALIAGEVALTVVLLAGSGLLIRSLIHLETLPPGFNPQGVMTAKASLDDARYQDPAAFQRLMSDSVAAMQRIPGVQSAGVGLSLPFERALNGGVLLHDGPRADKTIGSDILYATPGFFEALEMKLIAGRTFTAADGPNTQPVAIINASFAHKFFPGLNPVGLTVDKGTTIVGVVSDVQLTSGLNPTAPIAE